MSNEEKITNENDDFNEADLVSLLDDDGNEYEFEVLDEIDYEEGHYYALMPLFDLPDQEIESGSTYMIFEAVENENGEPQLAEIDNEELLDEIAAVFESNFDSLEEE